MLDNRASRNNTDYNNPINKKIVKKFDIDIIPQKE